MTDLTFDHLGWLHLLWAVAAVAGIAVLGLWRRYVALRRFAGDGLLPRLSSAYGWGRSVTRLGLVGAAMVLLVGAIIGPRWGHQEQTLLRRNVDVLILLDVSRSMLAPDIAPNRLERAKLAIRDDLIPTLGGDRVGLVIFAGVPSLACPLTADYGFFRLALDDVSTRSAPRGGTLIGDAIRKAGDLFERDQVDSHRLIILITDGEDHESFADNAAAAVWEDQRAAVLALGLGDPEQGMRIPLPDGGGEEYVTYQGELVRTRADFPTLKRIAAASPHGVFIPVGTSNFDLGAIYRRVVQGLRVDEQREQRTVRQPSRFHPFAIGALVLIAIDSLLRDGPRRPALAGVPARAKERAA